jgi:acetate kinase
MKILVLNAGSSSQKLRLYELTEDEPPASTPAAPLWAADADWGDQKENVTITISAHDQQVKSELPNSDRQQILNHLLEKLWQDDQAIVQSPSEIALVGHRVVHGGAKYQQSVLITREVKNELRKLISFAPLHEPANLEGMEVIERLLGQVPQVAVFDTAFHSQMPRVAQTYPGPYDWFEQGIRRYGFHGISHQYCARRSAELTGQELSLLRIVTCHLGNGCSLAAILGGLSIDTTMGFTPLEGLMMGTRSGSIDPSIPLYLQREHGATPEQVNQLLNHDSGLKGISGLSGDMRAVLKASEEGHERAQLALDLYIYRLRTCLGSMVAALGGIDVLTFAGGVGEHAPLIRARLCQNLGFLGLAIDENKNAEASSDQEITGANSAVRVLVIHTEEDWEIARECWHIHTRAISHS